MKFLVWAQAVERDDGDDVWLVEAANEEEAVATMKKLAGKSNTEFSPGVFFDKYDGDYWSIASLEVMPNQKLDWKKVEGHWPFRSFPPDRRS